MKTWIVCALLGVSQFVTAQVAINNTGAAPNGSAMLDITSPAGSPKGLLIPRMNKTDRIAMGFVPSGMLVYQTGPDSSGFYYYSGLGWEWLAKQSGGWNIDGNAGLSSLNFVGTTDNVPLRFGQNNLHAGMIHNDLKQTFFGSNTAYNPGGSYNSAFGTGALKSVLSGGNNIAIGVGALGLLDQEDVNLAIGDSAMYNFSGSASAYASNTAIGHRSFRTATAGYYNTLVGAWVMEKATGQKRFNTALGAGAMSMGTGGEENLAIGYRAMEDIAGGEKNVMVGTEVAINITSGSRNVGLGHRALFSQLTNSGMVAVGDSAMAAYSSATAFPGNTAVGYHAMADHTNGISNTAVGYTAFENAASDSRYNVAIGAESMAAGAINDYNTGVGYQSLNKATGANNVAIGALAMSNAIGGNSNTGLGYHALFNVTSNSNTAIGTNSLDGVSTGTANTGVGSESLGSTTIGEHNTAIGWSAGSLNNAGSNNLFVGYDADPVYTDLQLAAAIGHEAKVGADSTMSFGSGYYKYYVFGRQSIQANTMAFQVGVNGAGKGNGAYLTNGGTWTNTSDRNSKEDFSNIQQNDILQKVAALPISRWKYKGTNEYHIGPVAQDFYALFQTGVDDKTISTVDPSGVALAAIQALIQQNAALQKQIDELKKEIQKK